MVATHPTEIINAVLDTLASVPYSLPREVQAWQKAFAVLDHESVAKAVEARGIDAARSIGEFMPDPTVGPDGTPILPPITAWYLRTYGGDQECFRQFCIGRWNGRVRMGWAWERQSGLDQLVRAYSAHPIPSLRRWADVTKRDHEGEVERQRIQFEEDKRR